MMNNWMKNGYGESNEIVQKKKLYIEISMYLKWNVLFSAMMHGPKKKWMYCTGIMKRVNHIQM